jgi:hypothetical protein
VRLEGLGQLKKNPMTYIEVYSEILPKLEQEIIHFKLERTEILSDISICRN